MTTPYSPDELSEVIASLGNLLAAATPGPYSLIYREEEGEWMVTAKMPTFSGEEDIEQMICVFPELVIPVHDTSQENAGPNLKLWLNAVTKLPSLIATLEAQAAEIARWKGAVRDAEGNPPAESSCMDEHDMVIGREAYRDGWLDAVHSIYRTANAKGTP